MMVLKKSSMSTGSGLRFKIGQTIEQRNSEFATFVMFYFNLSPKVFFKNSAFFLDNIVLSLDFLLRQSVAFPHAPFSFRSNLFQTRSH